MKSGPIIIIEDDADDMDLLKSILRELNINNEIICFDNCKEAFKYLCSTDERPFLIFSDVNLPGQKVIDFKKQLDEDPELREKSIPFIFYSTSVDEQTVNKAYTQMTVQGFFEKKSNYEEIKKTLKIIIDYWECCRHPNSE